MPMQRATALEDFDDDDDVSGFGDRAAREERRAARRERKRDRRQDRRQRKVERRAPAPVRALPTAYRRAAPAVRPEPTLQPAPMSPPAPKRKPIEWVENLVDDLVDDDFDEPEDEEDATEGIGAWTIPSGRREVWGPAVRMGRRLRIQALAGHRAAVIDLKPGLYLVAELPEAVTRTEFGIAPILAPLMVNAARRAMDEPPRERRGPFARMFRRRQEEQPVRYVEVPAEPGEAATYVPAPNVGWADDATVAATYGCDTCQRGRR